MRTFGPGFLSSHRSGKRRALQRTTGALFGGGAGAIGGTVRNLVAIGAGYVGVTKGIGGTVGAAIKFEEAFADVRKVVNGTPAELSKIRSEILSMSKVLPNSAAGIAAIYAAAGQSNIPISELSRFSEMVAKVAVAWEVTEGETSDALAKIKNQLNMNVDQIGLYADAINHLGNNTAASAPDLVDFSKRVAAQGELFGFSATQTLALGGAMIAAGAQTNVAATSFRNMGNALTVGENASKSTRQAFARLGLESVKTAKKMQKDALGTTLDVLDRIQKLPEWERISVARALFGDEARALMPVISNATELRRQLSLVATEADYAGSSFEEYLVRAETAGNALAIIGNKFRALGIGIGDGWLPTIKELGSGIGDVLDTLDKRVGVLDQVKVAFQGFMGGLGYGGTGGARELMNDLGDLLFGKAFGGDLKQADDRVIGLARLSNRFRGIGQDLKSFADNVSGANFGEAAGNIGDALKKMTGGMTVTGALAVGATGAALIKLGQGALALTFSRAGQIAITAMAVATLINAARDASSLGEFVESLSSLSAIELTGVAAALGIVGVKVWSIVSGLRAWRALKAGAPAGAKTSAEPVAPKASPNAKPAAPKSTTPDWINKGRTSNAPTILEELGRARWRTGFLKGIGTAILNWAGEGGINDLFRAFGINPDTLSTSGNAKALWDNLVGGQDVRYRYQPKKEDDASSFIGAMKWLWSQIPSDLTNPIASGKGGPADVSVIGIPEVSVPAPVTTQPSGTQDVRVTNPMPAPVINITLNATTNASPADILATVKRGLSAELNALSRGAFSDGVA